MQWVCIEYYSFCIKYLWFFFFEEVFHAVNVVYNSTQVETLVFLKKKRFDYQSPKLQKPCLYW